MSSPIPQTRTLYFFLIVKDLTAFTVKTDSQIITWLSTLGSGGGERDRTDDLLLAKQALSQLSYTPGSALRVWWVWLGSNQRPPPYQDGALTS